MYILKNAFISITRNKGRNILIGIIILVIACACCVTLAINNTAKDLIDSYDGAYQKELTISFNRKSLLKDFDFSNEGKENIKEAFNNIQTYTIENIESFSESEHIESYYYTYQISLNGNNIDKANIETNENNNQGFNRGQKNQNMNFNTMDFTITGYSSISSMNEFINGTYTMNEITEDAWDIVFDGNYVFINQELASYNNLSLNDQIILEDANGLTYEFILLGIFEDNDQDNQEMNIFSNSANTIITNANTLVNIDAANDNINGTINPTFIIDDYENASIIQEEFYEKGLAETYVVETNQEIKESGLNSIKNVKSFAKSFLIITLIIGSIVLFVLNMINIRERKYEIGVFRTIGISKFKLTMQFVSELLIVALIALIIGTSLGAVMSKSISNSLLASEIENSNNNANSMKDNFGNMNDLPNDKNMPDFNKLSGTPNIQAYDSIDAVVNISVILELLLTCLVLILISSLAAMISIQRFSPLTILKERS